MLNSQVKIAFFTHQVLHSLTLARCVRSQCVSRSFSWSITYQCSSGCSWRWTALSCRVPHPSPTSCHPTPTTPWTWCFKAASWVLSTGWWEVNYLKIKYWSSDAMPPLFFSPDLYPTQWTSNILVRYGSRHRSSSWLWSCQTPCWCSAPPPLCLPSQDTGAQSPLETGVTKPQSSHGDQ